MRSDNSGILFFKHYTGVNEELFDECTNNVTTDMKQTN